MGNPIKLPARFIDLASEVRFPHGELMLMDIRLDAQGFIAKAAPNFVRHTLFGLFNANALGSDGSLRRSHCDARQARGVAGFADDLAVMVKVDHAQRFKTGIAINLRQSGEVANRPYLPADELVRSSCDEVCDEAVTK